MRERINKLARGIIDSESPKIQVAPSRIEETVAAGKITRREFVVTSENNLSIKGLAYSSDFRVKLHSSAFGGNYNHMVYEVDGTYLEDGDEIKGTFYLITSGGEKEIPYSFCAESTTSGKALGNLKTAQDFADIAKRDLDMALRLFEYRDFVEAPFMQDLKVRTLYDGLKGRPDRRKELEEFLQALKVKEPVVLEVECQEKNFGQVTDSVIGEICLTKKGWGYISLEAVTDCSFIELPKRNIEEQDFVDGKFLLPFSVHPAKMHQGRNFGTIVIGGVDCRFSISVTADLNPGGGISVEDACVKEAWEKYLRLRLDVESGQYENSLLRSRMWKELDEIELIEGENNLAQLFKAEISIDDGELEKGSRILALCRDNILAERQENIELYCYYQYLKLKLEPDQPQKESLIRLLRKYLEEYPACYRLFFLQVKTDERLWENLPYLAGQMRRQYEAGCRSPFLYLWGCQVFNRMPELIGNLGDFELQAVYNGSARGVVEEKTALAVADAVLSSKKSSRLHFRLLTRLYSSYPNKKILEAICAVLIRRECRQREAFTWYEKGVREGISLTRLYEYYLYALPQKEYKYLLPKEVLLYFSYGGNELDQSSREFLYKNVLVYLKDTDPLYQTYERTIEKFATEQLLKSHISSNLAVIYEHIIFPDVIDLPMARVLPAVLRSYRITCSNPRMKYVVVKYQELEGEDVYLLKDGTAYVPLYSDNSILLFQDSFGNRYGRIPCKKEAVMDKPDLEERCFELYPDHPMLRLRACMDIMKNGVSTEREVGILENTLEDQRIHPLYHKQLISRIIEYYGKGAGGQLDEKEAAYLVEMDKAGLTKEERNRICQALIGNGYMEEAFELIREYGYEGLPAGSLLKLCGKMILDKLFDQDDLLLHLSYDIFLQEKCDGVILDYLCEYFNGSTDQMYRLLLQGVSEHVETYDLEERLVAQMMFSGCSEKIDRVFDLYMNRKKTSENIVRAYFTIKSTEYFMEDKVPEDKVFTYLERALDSAQDKGSVPTVYLLALTRYYSTLSELNEDQKKLCGDMISMLIEEGMVFPYFKKLSAWIPLPQEIMDKAMIQYSTGRDARIDLQIRILPDEEEFHSEDIQRTYQGIFVKQKILFEGEIMEYRISEEEKGKWVLKEEGSVGCDSPASAKTAGSRFACLNEMSLSLSLKDEEGLRKRMEEYLKKTAAAEELFSLI
ncbi:MAG TPA: hypothetical protein H9740_10830 [Candidatus Hungatella pullicola]|nr:hypothetical protein [Candidatus Hungatella pullicola]